MTMTTLRTCTTCEIATSRPTIDDEGRAFCCPGCAAGGPCTCSYDAAGALPSVRHCLDVEGAVADRFRAVPARAGAPRALRSRRLRQEATVS